MRRRERDQATLITSAPERSGDGYDRRRKKYAIMMSIRAICVVLAATTYRISVVLALAFIVGGAVLPWCAVLIANDRPAKRKRVAPAWTGATPERALPSGREDRTVDG